MIHLHRTPHPALHVSRAALYPLLATACLHLLSGTAPAQELSTPTFTLRYDESGVRSLKRTSDVHDTDYVAPGGALGRLLVRYRATPNGDWRQLRDPMIRRRAGQTRVLHLAAVPPEAPLNDHVLCPRGGLLRG